MTSKRDEDVCEVLSVATLGRTRRDVEQTDLTPCETGRGCGHDLVTYCASLVALGRWDQWTGQEASGWGTSVAIGHPVLCKGFPGSYPECTRDPCMGGNLRLRGAVPGPGIPG